MNTSEAHALSELSFHLADLDEATVLDVVRQRISRGDNPLDIIEECQQGMHLVGERYEQRQYYLSALIVSGEILREVMDFVQPHVQYQASGQSSGRIILGTVRGDIHDLGKNLFHMMLRCYGFTVYDLDVDVPPAEFVAQVRDVKPLIVGLSGLLSSSYDSMQETVALLRSAAEPGEPPVPIVIGGRVDEQVCKYVGADYWITDAMEGVRLCQRLVTCKS